MLNPKKFVFGRDEVDFGGFCITQDRVKLTSDMIDAIVSFCTPINITGVCLGLGLSTKSHMHLHKQT